MGADEELGIELGVSNSPYGEAETAKVVRSVLNVNGICCAQEVPLIKSLILPLPGVVDVVVVVPKKQAYVDHNPNQTSAKQLVMALNNGMLRSLFLASPK
jgi:copper chaperone CopZ